MGALNDRPTGAAGEGDGDSIHRYFDEDRSGVGERPAEQVGGLVEQECGAGVEVLRSLGVVRVGVASADEPEHGPVRVGEGEHDPVAELVDHVAPGRPGRNTGG